MSKREMAKTVSGGVDRSGFHYFCSSAFLTNRTSEAGFDVMGSVIVVSLSIGVVLLMRFLLVY
jgi:hypothetical protein